MSDENLGPGGLRDDGGPASSASGNDVMRGARATTQDLAKRAGEQTSAATDVVYEQGRRAGKYLTRNVNEYPLTAVLIAGAIGYGIGYLIHKQSSQEWRNRREIEEAQEPRTLFMRSDYARQDRPASEPPGV